jgi:hypothetical protein
MRVPWFETTLRPVDELAQELSNNAAAEKRQVIALVVIH